MKSGHKLDRKKTSFFSGFRFTNTTGVSSRALRVANLSLQDTFGGSGRVRKEEVLNPAAAGKEASQLQCVNPSAAAAAAAAIAFLRKKTT